MYFVSGLYICFVTYIMPGPATQDEPDTSERKPVELEGETKAAERLAAGEGFLLYVHDAPGNAEEFAAAMRAHGFDEAIVVACGGEECLDFLFGEGSYEGRNTDLAPSLILLELGKARSEWLETLKRVRQDERTRLLPVVVFSATSLHHDVETAYRLGANAFVDTSSVPLAFPELVRQVARFWLVVNEPPPAHRAPANPIYPPA
jgi:CheY-like chemotaxis protein